jgi:hypothetical protein
MAKGLTVDSAMAKCHFDPAERALLLLAPAAQGLEMWALDEQIGSDNAVAASRYYSTQEIIGEFYGSRHRFIYW